MPQYLDVLSGGTLLARIKSGNLPMYQTWYRASLIIPDISDTAAIAVKDVDTGVERQPEDERLQQKDFMNDFKHAERGIATATAAAPYFRERVADFDEDHSQHRKFVVRLKTNDLDRGEVRVDHTSAQLAVGTGHPGAIPENPYPFDPFPIDFPNDIGSVHLALAILEQHGPEMVTSLAKQAQLSSLIFPTLYAPE